MKHDATATALLAPSPRAYRIVLLSLALSVLGALASLLRAGVKRPFVLAALEPLRQALMLACWCIGCAQRKVVWRGNAFNLVAGSRIVPLSPALAEEREEHGAGERSLAEG